MTDSARRGRLRLGLLALAIAVAAVAVAIYMLRSARPAEVARDPARRVVRPYRTPAPALPRASTADSARDLSALDWYTEPGVAPRRVAGVVRRPDGSPVVGARVETRSEWRALRGDEPPHTLTDERGHFELAPQPPHQLTVIATNATDMPAATRIDLRDPTEQPAPDALELVMRPCAEWSFGRVRDVLGAPVVGASATLASKGSRPEWFIDLHGVTTDEDGRFRICLGHRDVLIVRADGFGHMRLSGPMPRTGWDVVLTRGAIIEGQVVDARSRPVAGARAMLLSDLAATLPRTLYSNTTSTDADGRFRFADVEPGTYTVTAEHTAHRWNPIAPSVTVGAGEHLRDLRIQMKPCRELAGVVLLDGEPAAGVRLTPTVVTQRDGSFVGMCAPFEAFDLPIEGYDAEATHIPAGTEPIDDLVVHLRRRGGVAGTVTADGRPRGGVAVQAWRPEKMVNFGERHVVHTDERGAFLITSLPPGEWELRAATPDRSRRAPSKRVTLAGRERIEGIALELSHAARVHGTLLDRDGVPLPGVELHLIDRAAPRLRSIIANGVEATTNLDGEFELAGLEPATYELCLGVCGKSSEPSLAPVGGGDWPDVVVTSGDADIELRLVTEARSSGSIAGGVRYADGAPVAMATVKTWPPSPSTTTDAEGRFELTALNEGVYSLTAIDQYGVRTHLDGVATDSGAVELVVPLAGSVRGILSGGREDCTVSIATFLPMSYGAIPRALNRPVDDQGAFRFDHLEPANYRVEARCGELRGSATAEVRSNETTEVTVIVGDRASLRVHVRAPDDQPLVGEARCRAAGVEATVGDDGIAVMTGLPPGSLEVYCGELRGSVVYFGTARVDELPPGATVEVEVSLAAPQPGQ